MTDIVDHILTSRHEAANGGERLGEGGGDEIDFVQEAKVFRDAASSVAKDPNRVRFVDHQACTVLFLQAHELWDIRDVPLHTIDAVHDDQDAAFGIDTLEHPFEIGHIVVLEPHGLAERKAAAVDNACVYTAV